MATYNESTKWLYDQLKSKGYNVGKDLDEFDSLLRTNADSRKWAYDTATKSGLNVGKDLDEFTRLVGGQTAPEVKPPTLPTSTEGLSLPSPVEEVKAEPVPAETPAEAPIETPAEEPVKPAEPWRPTEQQKVMILNDLNQGMQSTIGSMERSMENVNRLHESRTERGRNKQKAAETQARIMGLPTKAVGLTPSGGGGGDLQAQDSGPKNPQSPVVAGVKLVDGEYKTEWLLPDGSLTTDFGEADKAEYGARKARLEREFLQRMKENGLDPGKAEDIEAQKKKDLLDESQKRVDIRLAENEENIREIQDKRSERFDESNQWDDNQGFWENLARIIGGNAKRSVDYQNPVNRPTTTLTDEDKDLRLLTTENQVLDEARKLLETRQLKKSNGFMGGFWNIGNNAKNMRMGAAHTLTDADLYASGIMSLQKASALLEIEDKLKSGQDLSDREVSLIYSTMLGQDVQQNVKTPHGYNAAQTTVEMFPFMAQMVLNPASGLSQALVKKFGKSGLKKVAWTIVGDVAESAVLANTLQAPATAADAMKRYQGNIVEGEDGKIKFDGSHNWATAIAKAEGAAIIENYTEMLGEHFGGILDFAGKWIGKGINKIGGGKILDTVTDLATRVKGTQWATAISNLEKRAHWNGVPGEVLEEEAGIVLNSLFVGDNKISDLWDADQQIDIVLGVGLFSGFMSGIKTVGYPVMRAKAKSDLNQRDRVGSWRFGEEWDSMRSEIDSAEEKDLNLVVRTLIRDHAQSNEQARAIVEYAKSLMTARGFELARATATSEGTVTPEQLDAEESYEHGMDIADNGDAQAMSDARLYRDRQRQRLVDATSEDFVAEHFDGDDAIGNLLKLGDDPELRAMVADYVNANQVYKGMIQGVRNDIDGQIAQSDAIINDRVNRESGVIQPATLKLGNRSVYIVSGEARRYEDTDQLDLDHTSESLIVMDAETGKVEFVDPKEILNIGETIDPEEEKEVARERIRQETAQRAADNIEGRGIFAPGETVMFTDEEGKPTTLFVLRQSRDENGQVLDGYVDIQYEDGRVESGVSVEELEARYNASREKVAEEFEEEHTVTETTEETDAEEEVTEEEAPVEETSAEEEEGFIPIDSSIFRPDEVGEITSPAETEEETVTAETEEPTDIPIETTEAVTTEAPAESTEEAEEATALSQIPVDETGNPIYESVEADTAWDALVEQTYGDEEIAQNVIRQHISEKEEELKKMAKKKPQPGLSVKEKIKFELDKKKAMVELQKSIDHWKRMSETTQRRQSAEEVSKAEDKRIRQEEAALAAEQVRLAEEEAKRLEEEARQKEEAERKEREKAEKAEKAALKKIDKRYGEVYEEVKAYPQAVERLKAQEPEDLLEAAAYVISNNKLLWGDSGSSVGTSAETGFKEGERKKLFTLFASKEKGGKSIAKLAEDEMQEICWMYSIPYENSAARDALIEMISQAGVPSDITQYIRRRRMDQALEIAEDMARYEHEAYEDWVYENYHMSIEEYEAYEEIRSAELEKAFENFDEKEYFGIIADEIVNRERNESIIHQGRDQRDESGGEGGSISQSDGLLSGLQSDPTGRTSEDAETGEDQGGQGVQEGNGYQILSENGALSQEPSRGAETEGISVTAQNEDRESDESQKVSLRTSPDDFDKQMRLYGHTYTLRGVEDGVGVYCDSNGEEMIYLAAASDYTYGGIFREPGTNRWSMKVDSNSDKAVMKEILKRIMGRVPEGAELYEHTNASVDGLRVFAQQLRHGWEKTGETYECGLNGADKANVLGEDHRDDGYMSSQTWEHNDIEHLRDILEPYLKALGLTREAVRIRPSHGPTGEIVLTLPVLRKKATPTVQTLGERITEAEGEVNLNPTEPQKEAGNYKKGHVQVGTFDVTIENPKGSIRSGVDKDGKRWETTMTHTYGYIRGTEAPDGDHIDVFLSSDIDGWNGRKVFVVDQYNPDGTFDEHKVMLGFNNREEAFDAYLSNYESGWEKGRRLDVTEVNLEDFEKWIQSSKRKTKPFAEYKSIKTEENATAHEGAETLQEKQNEEAEKTKPYSIVSKPYTNQRGVTLDTYLVTFDKKFTDSEKGRATYQAKKKKGWFDKETGGYMLRSREDAEAFAEDVAGLLGLSTEEKPISLNEIESVIKPTETEIKEWANEYTACILEIIEYKDYYAWAEENGEEPDGPFTLEEWKEYLKAATEYREKLAKYAPEKLAELDKWRVEKEAEREREAEEYAAQLEAEHQQLEAEKRKVLEAWEKELKAMDNRKLNSYIRKNDGKQLSELDDAKLTAAKAEQARRKKAHKPSQAPATYETTAETEQQTAEAVQPTVEKPVRKPSKWVDEEDAEEFNHLRDIIRNGLGQLNVGFPPELLYAGAKMSYLMMKHGVRKFAEYAMAMIEELGDAIRPHLKSLYNFTRSTEEVMTSSWANELTPFDEVMRFDTANFDKPYVDAMATAENVVAEEASQAHIEETAATIKDNIRQNSDGSTTTTITEGGIEMDITEGDFIPGVLPSIDKPKPEKKPTKGKPANEKPVSELSGDSAVYQERVRQEQGLVDDITVEIMQRGEKYIKGEEVKPMTMREVTKMAERYSRLKDVSATDMQELVERAMTILTRTTAKAYKADPKKAYERIVTYYRMQPSLNARDSERQIKQQYSTPTPFGFLMGRFTSEGREVGSVLEPSAGNGALTITFAPDIVHVNDIDERRLENLRALGFGQVTAQNGLLPFNGEQVDVVLTNPPFGTVTEKVYDGIFHISSLEGQMAINALDSMKDDGRAAIIIGGNTSYRTNGSMNPKDAAFFGYLYSHYNVVDVINISGKALYSRNGTGYDVRMILINGRKEGKFTRTYPPVKSKARAEQVTTFEELYKRVEDDIQQVSQMGHKPSDVQSETGTTTDGVQGTTIRIPDNLPDGGTGVRPGITSDGLGSTPGTHIGQPTPRNESGGTPGVDNGNGGNAGGTDNVRGAEPGTSGGTGSGSTQNDGGRSGGNGRDTTTSRPDGSGERLAVKPDLETEKVPYPNQSNNGFTLLSVVPAAQAEVLQRSLGEIGDVDQFLVDELGYSSKEELYGYLAAEQIDSVALAIHQMNKGNAFIIGDMTGVGKGRQGAALIRYAVRQGRCPIYFTQKPTLFTDNYRDLVDIGSSGLRPFIIASNPKDANIVDEKGNLVYKLPSQKEQKRVFDYIMRNGKLPPEYDYVLTTYDQIKNGTKDYEPNEDGTWKTVERKLPKKSKGYTPADYNGQARRDALARLALGVAPGKGNIAILDESHTVGGDSGCGRYMQMLTSGAHGVTFLSATFAKRADNMPIYAQRTAISEAEVKADELIEAIRKGGVTLQEIMSKQLVESGQMIRRERDFAGVTIDWLSVPKETDKKQRALFNDVASIFNDIRNFQNEHIKPLIEEMNEGAASTGGTVGVTHGTESMGVKNVPFASKMYNLVNQLLFALKVDAIADRTIENLKAGLKPVISFTNTMEGFLKEAPQGVEMDEIPNFSLTLMRALDGVMRYTEKDADENSTGYQIPLSQLSEEGLKAYNAIKSQIENLSSDLPISPMDAIRMKIEDAGYSVAEITGRTTQLDRTPDGKYIVTGRKDRDSKENMRDFNSGKLDVLMINKSGSTGISLHASSKFADQRQRVMIFAQFQSDINDEVQMRGRIDRSGQVVRGRYEYIMSTIPAEQRLQMMFKSKLKSLDANTTSSQKSKFNEMEIVDYLNKYGDQVVWDYMKEHPELEERLGDPLKMLKENSDSDAPTVSEKEDTTKKPDCSGLISRYLAFLSVEEQEEIFRDITEAYKVKIQLLDDAGENDLEITTMPLRAETKTKKLWKEGPAPNSGNAFADNTYVEEVEVDVLKKPMKRKEIAEAVRRLIGDKEGTTDWDSHAEKMQRDVDEYFQAKIDDTLARMKESAAKHVAKAWEKAISDAKKARSNGKNNFTDEEIEALANTVAHEVQKKEDAKQEKRREEITAVRNKIKGLITRLRAEQIYVVPQDLKNAKADMFSQTYGTFIGFKFNKNYTLGSSTVVFATLDGRRKVELALNDKAINSILQCTEVARRYSPREINAISMDTWDSKVPTQTRQKRYIITGNLLQALVDTEKGEKTKGNLISFSTIDGETRQGILMAENFKPSDLRTSVPLRVKLPEILSGKAVVSEDGDVKIERINIGWQHRGDYQIEVPKSKQRGGIYTTNTELLNYIIGNNFVTKGNKMVGYVTPQNITTVIDLLSQSPFNLTVLEESKLQNEEENRFRDGEGSYTDAEVSYENDPWSKAWGESIRTKREQKRYAERERQRMRDRATTLSETLGVQIEMVEDTSELKGRKKTSKGWYDTKTGKITVVVSNHKTAEDMEVTLLHEAVAHHGLRAMFGGQFDRFLDTVYDHATDEIKEKIDVLATRNGWNRRVATEEYLASLAETIDYEDISASWWRKIKDLFMKFLKNCGFNINMTLTDNELRYVLWMSWRNLQSPGLYNSFLGVAEKVAKEHELGVGMYADERADSNVEERAEGNADETGVLFRDGDFTPHDRVTVADIYERMVASGGYQFKEAMQDSMLGLKKLYEAILGKGKRIEDVAGYENAYLYENRMSSANNAEQHRYFTVYMKPLLESVHRLCGSDAQERRILTDYMMAKHGLERNEYMRNEAASAGEDTDRDFAGLCGLTGEKDWKVAEAAAQQMVDDYENDHNPAMVLALWDNVNRSTKATLEKIYMAGLISEDTYNEVSGMYQYYIPLRGWDETTSDEVYGYLTSKEGPLLNGNVFHEAHGRASKADDPIATIAMMADDAIRQGNRNIMKQRFLNFVHGNPSDLVSVNELWLEYDSVNDEWVPVFADLEPDMTHAEVESEIKKFEAKMEGLQAAEPDKYKRGRDTKNIPYKAVRGNLNEHQVLVKRNGRTYVMTINGNPRAAQALNGLTNPNVDMGGVVGNMLKAGEMINRQLSAFYTTRNPDFVMSNFMRDMLYSNCMTWIKENPRYALRFHKNFLKVNPARLWKLLTKWENDKLNTGDYMEKMFKDFMLHGGETGYTSVRDIEQHKRAIAAELKRQGSVGRKAWNILGEQLDRLNRSVENCARFAAFVTSREMGRTIDRSIFDAKEISVNFNKKGSGGKFVNATGQKALGKFGSYLSGGGRLLYVFWNAGVQGLTNFGRAGKRNPGKAIAGASTLFTLGAVIPLLAQMLGGGDGDDDDKNAYYNLPEYIRRSNICFKAGDQWIVIPLPIEYRSMYGMGELATGVISGNERYSNSELTRQIAGQFSQILPLDMLEGGGGVSPLIPSSVKPFTEAYIMNKGWTGLPVYKDTPYNKKDPEWTKAYKSADQHLVDMTRWLNETSGGDNYKKGKIDINPAKLEYLLNGTFGGVISFPMKIKKTGETIFGDRDFEWRNIPLANRVVKSGDERTEYRKLQKEYYKYKEEAEDTKRLRTKYEEAAEKGILGYAEKADFLYNSDQNLRYEIYEEFRPDIDAIYQALKDTTDPAEKKTIEGELYGTMRQLVNALNNPETYLKDTGVSATQ